MMKAMKQSHITSGSAVDSGLKNKHFLFLNVLLAPLLTEKNEMGTILAWG
jgi:hypothetical protein